MECREASKLEGPWKHFATYFTHVLLPKRLVTAKRVCALHAYVSLRWVEGFYIKETFVFGGVRWPGFTFARVPPPSAHSPLAVR